MNKFFNAITTADILTENGMATHSTSGSFVVDFFYRMAASRNGMGLSRSAHQMNVEIVKLFNSAWAEDPLTTLRSLFYLRDVRGGQGERQIFRALFRRLCFCLPEIAIKNIPNIPYFGRWDDLFAGLETPIEKEVMDFLLFSLKSGDKLCAKWMPRENKSLSIIAKMLMKYWGLTPREYRKLLAGNTEVVETLMCNREWEKINYEHVPSRAMYKYRKAFPKRDPERFAAYIEALQKGEKKVNASVLYPHEIVRKFLSGDLEDIEEKLLEEMWKALPDFVGEGSFITVNDVSGSMNGEPMEVSIALGIYLSQKNKSVFKDGFITFSGQPKLQYLKGSLRNKINSLGRAEWGYNTNLAAVFDLILNQAVRAGLVPEDLPSTILIISDMQFDQATGRNFNPTAYEMIEEKYKYLGYKIPRIVFWNVRNSSGIPGKADQKGVALVSGYSPSIMKYLLKGELDKFTPIQIVKDIVESPRYERVVL